MAQRELLLEIRGLKTYFPLDEGLVKAVDGVDLEIPRGGILSIVGESGSGKTVTGRSILQIVDPPGRIIEGSILFRRGLNENGAASHVDVLDLASLRPSGREMCGIRGREISMIFQEPLASFSPIHSIGDQLSETYMLHAGMNRREARESTVAMLRRVGIPKPEVRMDVYPFQLSGGMRQRAMIAMALCCSPSLVIADEPTTALDVTTQAQILDLLRELQDDLGMAVMLITHDLGVVAETADDVAVMYLGWVAERGDVDSIFNDPKHPYTQALLRSIPTLGVRSQQRLDTIRGSVPSPYARPGGCVFHPRCERVVRGLCDRTAPPTVLLGQRRSVRCWLYADMGGGDCA